jgi:hypothetical protein
VSTPGFAFARPISSCKDLAATEGFTTNTSGFHSQARSG